MADSNTGQAGYYIVGKSPIHTQLVIKSQEGKTIYIPVKNFTWNKTGALDPNHHSGTPQVSDLIDGPIDYTWSFETGTWLTEEVNKENGEAWEYLAYTHLVRPFDAGRPKQFTAMHRQSNYYDDDGAQVGGKNILWFTGCKVEKMSMSQGENGIVKRTYEGKAKRMTYGNNEIEDKTSSNAAA
jgi:hypothetical protein